MMEVSCVGEPLLIPHPQPTALSPAAEPQTTPRHSYILKLTHRNIYFMSQL